MKNVRTYAVLVSIAASVTMLAGCSDNDTDELSDTGAAVESPATQSPPATTVAPAATQTPPATTTTPETTPASPTMETDGTGDDSASDITPEPDNQ